MMFARRVLKGMEKNPMISVQTAMQFSVSTRKMSLPFDAGYHTRNCSTRHAYASRRSQGPRRRTFCANCKAEAPMARIRSRTNAREAPTRKRKIGAGEASQKLTEPKPFSRAVLRSNPSIEKMALKHKHDGETAHPVEIRQTVELFN